MPDVKVPKKWRPSLALLVTFVVGVLVILPFAALVAARVTSNQFARETEGNLHAQAAIYAQIFANAYAQEAGDPTHGPTLTEQQQNRVSPDWHPVPKTLVATNDTILSPRADPLPTVVPPDPVYLAISDRMSAIATAARKTTLVGFLALDASGNIIAKSGTDVGNLAHVDEVDRALSGDIVSVARWREEEYRNHSLRSLSRDTKFRVYVAHPVIVGDRVVGAIYLSRTPSNLNKYLFQQRNTFLWLLASVAIAAALIGYFLWRHLARPMRQLTKQAQTIAAGQDEASLPGYGVTELADLGQSLMDMGATLRRNADSLQTYTKHATHELKSPVTSIMGAAELLEAEIVDDTRRIALAHAIKSDAGRMDTLLVRMRQMAQGQARFAAEPTTLAQLAPSLQSAHPDLAITIEGDANSPLPLPQEAARICLMHVLENAAEHGASAVALSYHSDNRSIQAEDDGAGISEANLHKVTQPFFTTKRETGGTGMGLAICAEILKQFGGGLSVVNNARGVTVIFQF